MKCNICGDDQEETPDALNAWDNLLFYTCLCVECYWQAPNSFGGKNE